MDFRWSESHQQNSQTPTTTDPYAAAAAAQLYNAQQHPYAHYPYYPQGQNPNPSPSNSKQQNPSAQFDSVSSEASLRPPGIDHFTPNPYLPHGGYDGQSALQFSHPQMMQAGVYFADPALQQSWASQEAFQQSGVDHAAYAATVGLANGIVGQNPNAMWNSMGRHFVKGAMKKGPKKVKVVQSAWCEICKIECNSKDVLDKHKSGKKHKKNLEKREEAKKEAAAAAEKAQNLAAVQKETPSGEASGKTSGQATRRKGGPAAEVEDLETKRRKLMESGAAPDSLRVCAICNVAVNSETVFNYHLAGQKHAAQLKKQAAAAAGAGAAAVAGPQAVTAS